MRVILATFPDRQEIYSSLKPFWDKYPELAAEHRNKVNHKLSHKKEAFYECYNFRLQRYEINNPQKPQTP